jgi:hypothetical protein
VTDNAGVTRNITISYGAVSTASADLNKNDEGSSMVFFGIAIMVIIGVVILAYVFIIRPKA